MKKILSQKNKTILNFFNKIIDEEAKRVNEFNALHLGGFKKGGES